LIVFPPGTRIGIVAQTRTEAEQRAEEARRDADQAIEAAVVTEADAMRSEMLAKASAAVERVQVRRASAI